MLLSPGMPGSSRRQARHAPPTNEHQHHTVSRPASCTAFSDEHRRRVPLYCTWLSALCLQTKAWLLWTCYTVHWVSSLYLANDLTKYSAMLWTAEDRHVYQHAFANTGFWVWSARWLTAEYQRTDWNTHAVVINMAEDLIKRSAKYWDEIDPIKLSQQSGFRL